MARNPKPSPQGKKRQKYDEHQLNETLHAIRKKKWSINFASKKSGIPRSTLQNYMKKNVVEGESSRLRKLGRKCVLSETEEKVLVDILTLSAKWGCPFQLTDIRTIVKEYLDSIPRIVPFFNNNKPGDDWARGFVRRHRELRIKFAENLKRSRAEVSRETIDQYFKNVKAVVDNPNDPIDPTNLVNYDESAFVDDAKKKKVGISVNTLALFLCTNTYCMFSCYV